MPASSPAARSGLLAATLSALLLPPLLTPAAAAVSLRQVEVSARSCLGSSDPGRCRQAMLLSEALQRAAGNADNYPCQTLALGLGADMLMQEWALNRQDSATQLLGEMRRICRGF